MALTPRARTIILTDAGTFPYSDRLATYDGTAVVPPSVDNTAASSNLPASVVAGAAGVFGALYARLAPITARSPAQAARRAALDARIAPLEI